ncbi:MAG: fumarylacetoacetate hydrolase family protein [Chloroflexi bacterium]|nr:fumarylacetoacetate hydrolase family protein [Chloroflexota bacterium]
MIALLRYYEPGHGPRVGVRLDDTVFDVSAHIPTVAQWLNHSAGRVEDAIDDLRSAAGTAERRYPFESLCVAPDPHVRHLLPPIDTQDVWAAGVTYERSREARQEESQDGGDVYARVYAAERPELFFKARGPWVVGPLGEIGIRRDSAWNVPEPELTLVVNPALEVVGYTAGNDVSSRDIEGENPLYLPQAKVYTASCALGPQIALVRLTEWPSLMISVRIERGGAAVFEGSIGTDRIHRRSDELVTWLGRSMQYPDGVLLMTGTGIVPGGDFTLSPDDAVHVTIPGAGTLTNRVKVV